jgi:hypothetical protein
LINPGKSPSPQELRGGGDREEILNSNLYARQLTVWFRNSPLQVGGEGGGRGIPLKIKVKEKALWGSQDETVYSLILTFMWGTPKSEKMYW